MTLDHIILLSIAEVRRRQLQQQAILVEKLKQHIVQNKVVDASNSGTVSDYPSTRSRSKSSIVFRDNGDISIDEVDGSRTTFSANKIVSLSPDYAKTTSAHTIRLDGKKFEVLLRVKAVKIMMLPCLETHEFNRLSMCSKALQKSISEEKQLWKASVRALAPPSALRGKLWMHCGGVASFLKGENQKGFYFKLVDKCHNPTNLKWVEEINFDVQHIEALLATSFNNSSSNDEVSGNELFRAADFKTTLRNILYAYITFDPDLGYCNGMCSLVGFMLWWLRDINPSQSEVEQRVFFLLLVLLDIIRLKLCMELAPIMIAIQV